MSDVWRDVLVENPMMQHHSLARPNGNVYMIIELHGQSVESYIRTPLVIVHKRCDM